MSREVISIRGRCYLTLETVAHCYRVEVKWVHEVYEMGMLGRGELVGGATAVEAAMLDRMGRILRLHRQQGINLAGIFQLLEDPTELVDEP